MKILHITDFHIDTPSGDKENLREGFYEEFIDGLFKKIVESQNEDIDLIVHTGDFVNIGKTENYGHARKVVDYLLKKCNLSKSEIAVCIGNHDFKLREKGSWEEKKAPFVAFGDDLLPGEFVDEVDRAKLYFNKEHGIQILVLDNASREDDKNEPVSLSIAEQDNIVNLVRKHVDVKDLIVASHYPMLTFPLSKYASEDQDWVRNHVWKDGFNIQNRLSQVKQLGKVLFLCGDGHIPDAFMSDNKQFVMTGLFGGDYSKRSEGGKSFYINTQARIIDFKEESLLHTFNYKPSGFEYDVSNGIWDVEVASFRTLTDKPKGQGLRSESRTSILSEPLEAEIINRIKKEKLYKLGRFVTSSEFNSLSWVSINRIFEEQQIFVSLIDKALEWLCQIIKDNSKSLIIGVDFYGAMIGAHLGLRANLYNVCFASRFIENENSITMLLGEINNIEDIKDVVIITDVVSSGHSVLQLIKELEIEYEKIERDKLNVKFHSISVISDTMIERQEFDKRLTSIKTACGSLRMPIIRSEELPDKDILASRLDFTS